MLRKLSWISTGLVAVALALPGSAAAVIVPDDYPTIQAAIDAAAEVIQVREGLPAERLTVSRAVVIEPGPGPRYLDPPWVSMPSIQSLEIVASYGPPWGGVRVRGVRFLGNVSASLCDGVITFESCRFDSGLAAPCHWFARYSVRGCLFLGPVDLAGYVQFVGNTVIGSPVSIWADGVHDIRNNYILGPAEAGLILTLQASSGSTTMNTIRGTTDGILVKWGGGAISMNDISDCSGDGIVCEQGSLSADANHISKCGGAGIRLSDRSEAYWGSAWLMGNDIRQTRGDGIELGSNTMAYDVRGNVVLDAGGDGIQTDVAGLVSGNVVGRSGDAGIRVTGEPYRVFSNTVFSSRGPGLVITGQAHAEYDSVFRNLAAFNSGPGLQFKGTGALQLGCNDWFGNAAGAVMGIAPGATDLEKDPAFCDLAAADVRLAANSPLLAAPGCGLIGALGEGCGAVTAVGINVPAEPTRLHAWPVPARGEIVFDLPRTADRTRLEVFDVTGALRWGTDLPPGTSRLAWDRRDASGRVVVPGVYFARLRREGAEVERVKVVLTE